MPKRARGEMSMSSQQRAAAISAAIGRKYPYADYGRVMHQRGTSSGIARYGDSWKDASAEQRLTRKSDGYYGRGLYTGRGSYGKSNALMSGSDSGAPMFQSSGDETGALMVTHREYVGDIYAPPSSVVDQFNVQAFPINPGLEQSFPWLSQIAQNYEEYELVQCVYEFVSTVQDVNSANGQVGTIITATQYNSSRPLFTDKPQMAAYAHSVSGKSTENQTHGVECDPRKLSGSEGKYVRANPVLTGQDLKTYDHGIFQLATHNIPSSMASGTLGELYCQYTVKLRKPKFFTGRGLGITRAVFAKSADQTSIAEPFSGLAMLSGLQNNLACVVSVPAPNQTKITFPAYYAGRLAIQFRVDAANGAATGSVLGGYIQTANSVTGNVTFISDMVGAPIAGASGVALPSSIWQVSSADGMCMQISLDIEPATSAEDNTITITHGITETGGAANSVIGCTAIDISEYNTFQKPGAADYVNASGVLIVPTN